MAKRLNVMTIPTDDVQGAGSFIKVRAMTVTEHNQLEQTRVDMNKAAEAGKVEEAARLEKSVWAQTAEVLLDWDWVDGDDKALPKPHQNPDVFDLLTMAEVFTIAEALSPFAQRQKKAAMTSPPSS
jgi:hypothetical protein